MQNHDHPNLPLLSLPMGAVLLAQFFSALADNALLIAAIALIKVSSDNAAMVPRLQEVFVVPFILLAPFLGPLADALPKARVMLIGNSLKLAGAVAMVAGLHPLAAYALVGIGASVYSPAKYGILSQLFAPDRLVKANGMLEGSTIAAILLGVLVGGALADSSLDWAFAGVVGLYLAATLANLFIPKTPVEHPPAWAVGALFRDFHDALRTLWRNRDARLSLLGTGLFWGTGSTLRLALFAWVPVALGLMDNGTPAKLMGLVSIGIVAGAVLAGMLVRLEQVNRALVGGLLLGPLVLLLSGTGQLIPAIILLMAVGLCGGFFVVPLNALLQERGHESVGAGRALAVQNLFENLAMLAFVAAYTLTVRADIPVTQAVMAFGLLVTFGVVTLSVWRLKGKPS